MGGQLKRVLVVGCVPATLGPEEGQMGLSEPVTAAVDEAVKLIDSLSDANSCGRMARKEMNRIPIVQRRKPWRLK